jgi:hypothetical protein
MPTLWSSSPVSTADANPHQARTASVMVQTGQMECEVLRFDNDSGRTTTGSGLCESGVTLDAHGVPVPTGTIHRLDAISRSFSGSGQ